ncbi:MAG: UMP kinase [Clostridia bacterium]|nr:UMP kinase [Clostridia bacterium]MDY2900624.1 UMP kinase [Christensenellaceae bacterium]
MKAKYKRILLKISGEALSGASGHGFDSESLKSVAEQILEVAKLGVEVGIVVGGGNIWRGRQGMNMDRVTADQMGMLATVINALAVSEALIGAGADARVLTSIEISGVGEKFNHKVADRYLKEGKIVVFGGGTGNPFFSTDTGASLKAAEIGADALLLAKNIDGIYDSDPKINPNAKKFDELTYDEYVARGLRAMDTSAVVMCKENGLKVHAFGLSDKNSIVKAVAGDKEGTVIY